MISRACGTTQSFRLRVYSPTERKCIMAKCEICGKSPMFGNNVPHSLHKTKRNWRPNIQKVTVVENGRSVKRHLCTKCLRTMTKSKAV